jgi:hypothetical protein
VFVDLLPRDGCQKFAELLRHRFWRVIVIVVHRRRSIGDREVYLPDRGHEGDDLDPVRKL